MRVHIALLLSFHFLLIQAEIPLPPLLPKEYQFEFQEWYYAESLEERGVVVSDTISKGNEYWSYSNKCMRAHVMDQNFLSFTVTNYSNTQAGSLVGQIKDNTCYIYPVEGGNTIFMGYDGYRLMFQDLQRLGVPIQYWEENYSYKGHDFGSVQTWSATPPTGEKDRILTYTISTTKNEGLLVRYQLNGTEHLPYQGKSTLVRMENHNIRFNYKKNDDNYKWDKDFFSLECPLPKVVCFEGTGDLCKPRNAPLKCGEGTIQKEDACVAD